MPMNFHCLDEIFATANSDLAAYVAGSFDARVKSPVWNWTDNHPAKNLGKTSDLRREVSEWAQACPEIRRYVVLVFA